MKDLKEKLKNVPNQKSGNQKKDLRSMSMDELVKVAKEKNIPVKMDLNKEGLIKAIEAAR